jgi:hypothetical protein
MFNLSYMADDPATAIRALFLVWEDPAFQPAGTDDFRWVRNFVSHARIDREKTLNYIEGTFGKGTVYYNPFDQGHFQFVYEWKNRIEEALRVLFEERLGLR